MGKRYRKPNSCLCNESEKCICVTCIYFNINSNRLTCRCNANPNSPLSRKSSTLNGIYNCLEYQLDWVKKLKYKDNV